MQFPVDGNLDWGGLPARPDPHRHLAVRGHRHAGRRADRRRAVRLRDRLLRSDLSGSRLRLADLLARSPFTNFLGSHDYTQNTSLYCAHSGAFVFATGTMDWAWGLAPGGSSDGAHNNVRRSLKRLTSNVLSRMLDDPAGCASAAP